MRASLIAASVMLASCGSTTPNSLVANDWTNGQRPCSEGRLSFKGDGIGYEVRDGRISLFDIVRMRSVPKSPDLVMVLAKPAKQLQDNIASRGIVWKSTEQPIFLFRARQGRLSLVGLSRPGHDTMRAPTADQASTFDLIACPS